MSELDLVIRGAQVVDGTGRPVVRPDGGAREGRIESIDENVSASRRGRDAKTGPVAQSTLDADDFAQTPGFAYGPQSAPYLSSP